MLKINSWCTVITILPVKWELIAFKYHNFNLNMANLSIQLNPSFSYHYSYDKKVTKTLAP